MIVAAPKALSDHRIVIEVEMSTVIVTPELVRAILEARDNRHTETHAALVALWQALVAELADAGAIAPDKLAGRLNQAHADVDLGPHGDAARALIVHSREWVKALAPGEKPPHPKRWRPPAVPAPGRRD